MDRIKTTPESLAKCESAVRKLDKEISDTVFRITEQLRALGPDVDASFQKELTEYTEYLDRLKKRVGVFAEENGRALRERRQKAEEYIGTMYRNRSSPF